MSEVSATTLHFREAMAKMCAPSQKGVICIDITNKCDLACSNCTRLLENQETFWEMTPDNFRAAVRSLRDYPGVIAVIGGNPAMHRDFQQICEIFAQEIPDKSRRGLWTNNIFKYADLAKETFGVFNLNPHGNERGAKSLLPLIDRKVDNFYDGHSTHAPILAAVKDIFPEDEMWERISKCDINQNWSATIVQNNGNLRVYFCEVAASFDLARGTDNGFELTEGWWQQEIGRFELQIAHFCPGCGVPARIKGFKDSDQIDGYTVSNTDLAEKSLKKKRKTVLLTPDKISFDKNKANNYSSMSRSPFKQLAHRVIKRLRRIF